MHIQHSHLLQLYTALNRCALQLLLGFQRFFLHNQHSSDFFKFFFKYSCAGDHNPSSPFRNWLRRTISQLPLSFPKAQNHTLSTLHDPVYV